MQLEILKWIVWFGVDPIYFWRMSALSKYWMHECTQSLSYNGPGKKMESIPQSLSIFSSVQCFKFFPYVPVFVVESRGIFILKPLNLHMIASLSNRFEISFIQGGGKLNTRGAR